MVDATDYLNITEKRELAEIAEDRMTYRAMLKTLRARKQKLYVRAKARMDAAQAATGARR